jgi:hypothetical protein
MQTKNYWVGDRPQGNWTFQVLDQKTGAVQSLVGFTSANVRIKDPRNKDIEVPDHVTVISDPANGMVSFTWPPYSLFTRPGTYVVQLELSSATATRRTTVQDILVRELGGVIN